MTVFGYLIQRANSREFAILFLRLLLSFTFDWESISNTQNSVWPHFQVSRSSSKYCAARRTFTSLLSVWKVFKHVFSCLISYNIKNHTGTVTIEAESLNGIPSKSWKTWRKYFGVIDFFHFTSENQPTSVFQQCLRNKKKDNWG